MIEFALLYARAGYKVFPCRPKGKIPLTAHGVHDATTDEATIREWWGKNPEANIGLATDGLVVVDIDPRNGGDVDALPPLPETCYAKTGGGGWHYVYRARADAKYAKELAPGVDLKSGAGQYIVVEPSVTDGKYCWLDESEPWRLKPAMAPEFIGKREAPRKAEPLPEGAIREGGRNAALTSLAGAMRRRGASPAAILAALTEENRRCVPPLPDAEVGIIAKSVSRYAPAEEQGEDDFPSTVTVDDVWDRVVGIYEGGVSRGTLPGWKELDKLFSVATGQMTVVTGWPNSGKSQWLDALALKIAAKGWRGTYCSLENIPIELHVEKLLKQVVGKPLRDGPNPRMTLEELHRSKSTLREWFGFVLPSERKHNPSLQEVIWCIENDFRKRGLWGSGRDLFCVIDPWNELEHVRPNGTSLTEHIGASLSMLRQWARRHAVHVFLVGHPSKQQRIRDSGKLPIATPDMISDSAHFWNKADNCITVALTDEHRSAEVDIHVQKIRFSHIGSRGTATLVHDRVTGSYMDSDVKWTGLSRVV